MTSLKRRPARDPRGLKEPPCGSNPRWETSARRGRRSDIQRALGFAEECHGPGGIDERNIAHDQPHSLIILDHRRFAGDLKQSKIMLQAVETNVALLYALPGARYNRHPLP